MKQDRFLLVILAGIGLLVVVALGLFLARRGLQDYGPEDAAEGVLRNYVLALEKLDYRRAYGYLPEGDGKPEFDQFRSAFLTHQLDISNTAVQIGERRGTEEEAVIDLVVIRGGGGPFADIYRESSSALLEKDDGGAWKIVKFSYPYWGWDWYVTSPKLEIESPS